MDGFCDLVRALLIENGLTTADIFTRQKLELPGYFRPTKKWDLIVKYRGQLVAALEFKSMAGSFGNNFNNRAEEAIGTGKDINTAIREGAFGRDRLPWLGWVMLLEDCEDSRVRSTPKEPHFEVFREFKSSSIAERFELLLRKLVAEKFFNDAALLMCTREQGQTGRYTEPASDLTMKRFLAGLAGHVAGFTASL
jgi:type II restriction enzyme